MWRAGLINVTIMLKLSLKVGGMVLCQFLLFFFLPLTTKMILEKLISLCHTNIIQLGDDVLLELANLIHI